MSSNKLLIKKVRDDAVLPSRAYDTDSGYDITLTHLVKENDKGVKFYGTGISVKPPNGYYTEIVPRSSITKTGHILANNVAIIDESYRGEILVALIKVDKSLPNIELPIRLCQMIVRKRHDLIIDEVVGDFEKTDRGDGGFGSTG